MPYDSIDELPEAVQKVLPKHAQDIYKEAFNSAFQQYRSPKDRQGDESREQAAHKVAWAAVKDKYTKGDDDRWHPKK
ncbi:putative cation transport regulator ChaB [Acidipropionibacterium thoenii]|uniref:putative cation transport regulator ChaB n=1 Tax=Acidipropionibacterium thoenii TaxID=1751 RepID=UPI00040BF173|nr:putative cation transport regulator ChaB [Acidipropionibacterium thoenii]